MRPKWQEQRHLGAEQGQEKEERQETNEDVVSGAQARESGGNKRRYGPGQQQRLLPSLTTPILPYIIPLLSFGYPFPLYSIVFVSPSVLAAFTGLLYRPYPPPPAPARLLDCCSASNSFCFSNDIVSGI